MEDQLPLDDIDTRDQKAVKPSTDIEELLGDIHAGLRDLHFRVLELERSTKVESKA